MADNPSSPEDQAKARERQGFLCNWTGSYCPRGCATSCTMTIDRTLCGGGVEVIDFNTDKDTRP